MKIIKHMLYLCVILFSTLLSEAKEWHGIKPLYSSRVDVERLLGPSSTSGQHASTHETDSEVITIIYASGSPCGGNATNSWKVPLGTVIDITVSPKTEVRFSSLNIDLQRYKKTEDLKLKGLFYFIDEEEGVRYTVQEVDAIAGGLVMNVNYFPGAQEQYLRCAALTQASQDTHFYHPFETYGNINFNNEKVRLDNFAIQLQKEANLKGYIIAYGGQRSYAGQAQARAERAKNYLVKTRRINAKRIVAVDGGYREKFEVELYLLPQDLAAPIPSPTITLNKVHIIKKSKGPYLRTHQSIHDQR